MLQPNLFTASLSHKSHRERERERASLTGDNVKAPLKLKASVNSRKAGVPQFMSARRSLH